MCDKELKNGEREEKRLIHSDCDQTDGYSLVPPRDRRVSSLTHSFERFWPFVEVFGDPVESRGVSDGKDAVRGLTGSCRDVVSATFGIDGLNSEKSTGEWGESEEREEVG